MTQTLIRWVKRLVLFTLVLLMLWMLIPYIICPVYHYPTNQSFQGREWYNPYQDLNSSWLKANFQVQSLVWQGITDGKNTTSEVYNRYKSLGYDIITISDYQSINRFVNMNISFIPVYEHGYNIRKAHQVVIGAEKVEWQDFLLWQNRDHKQYILNLLKRSGRFVVLAHPILMNAYSPADLQNLVEYDAIEVISNYRNSSPLWDAALSSGKSIWIIANDDSHNIYDTNQTGVCWTMICAPSTREDDVINALQRGQMYGVTGKYAINHTLLERVAIINNNLEVRFSKDCREIRFIGQGGIIRKTVRGLAIANLGLVSEDTYIRIEAYISNNTLFLNPILRYDGISLPKSAAIVDYTYSALQYGIWVIFISGFALYGIIILIPLRRPSFTKANPEIA